MGVIATPSVRKRAREYNIDLNGMVGSGKNGRILMDDVLTKKKVENSQSNTFKEIPISEERKQIAAERIHAVKLIPHITHYDEIDITRLQEFLHNVKMDNGNVLLDVFFCKALAYTLVEFPVFNAELDEEQAVIYLHENIDIGLKFDSHFVSLAAVQLKTMKALYKEIQVEGYNKRSTFTFKRSGGIRCTPMIQYPQTSAIVIHKSRKVPVLLESGNYEIKSFVNISFAFDHRVADGADAVRFTNRLKAFIEQPERLFFV